MNFTEKAKDLFFRGSCSLESVEDALRDAQQDGFDRAMDRLEHELLEEGIYTDIPDQTAISLLRHLRANKDTILNGDEDD